MSDDREEWGPWIEHDGTPKPSLMGVFMRVQTDDGREDEGVQNACSLPPLGQRSCWCWSLWSPETQGSRITYYRIRKPRALRDLIRLAEDLPQQERIDA